jgi:mRNA interferase MazF
MSALKTTLVAPMTSKGFSYPTRIQYTFQGKKGMILLDQMRAVDKSRLIQKLGIISQRAQIEIINCLQELFAY